jgi:hypothetical protein
LPSRVDPLLGTAPQFLVGDIDVLAEGMSPSGMLLLFPPGKLSAAPDLRRVPDPVERLAVILRPDLVLARPVSVLARPAVITFTHRSVA